MSTFALVVSCFTMSDLPGFTDLTFQVPTHYCSLQHWTLVSPPDTCTTGHRFCCGRATSFFLGLFLHSSPGAYWTPSDLGSSSCSVISFCLFILFMGCSRQEYWSGWTMFCQNSLLWPFSLGWPCTAWLIELLKSLCHDKAVIHEGAFTFMLHYLMFPISHFNFAHFFPLFFFLC